MKKVKIKSKRSWITNNYIVYDSEAKHKQYQSIYGINIKKKLFNYQQLTEKYLSYVKECNSVQVIYDDYKLLEKGYECTTNSWFDVDSLGVTIHHETPGIWSHMLLAKNANQAKYMFRIWCDNEVDYTAIRVRRQKGLDTYILKKPEIYFPIIKSLSASHIKILLTITNNNLDKMPNFPPHETKISGPIEMCEWFKSQNIMQHTSENNIRKYSLTKYGHKIVSALLPTNNILVHFSNLI